jgi:trehalose 6-phosphate synthase/phosphatase
MAKQHERLIVLSNRLPFSFRRDESGKWRAEPSGGGLVTALVPVLRHRGGIWIGWPGGAEDVPELSGDLPVAGEDIGFTLQAVSLTADEVRNFYEGFSNEVIWPLFHDMTLLCNFDPTYWRTYREVNKKFARAAHQASNASDFIWVHDYHLMNVALELRRLGTKARIGFFLHIPFPPPDIFLKLPWRMAVIDALLQFDLVGFQTVHDRRNFLQCVRALVKGADVDGRGQVLQASVGGREVRIGNFPISIDYNAFMRQAASPEVAARAKELHRLLPNRNIILGIDRLDYTKGIPLRLQAFHDLLTRYPELRERVSLIQVVVPSREDIAQYRDLKIEIERIVGRINGSFVQPGGWVPVWYVYRSLSRLDLIAYYRAANIGLITPLKDGMNLVAKEYCACSVEEDCTLILSEFAGAAAQLGRSALLVNPFDVEGVADTIHRAYHMNKAERQARMRRMRRSIREYDVFWWVDSFLRAAITKDLRAFPLPENHVTDESVDQALLF